MAFASVSTLEPVFVSLRSKPCWSVFGKRMFLFCGIVFHRAEANWPNMQIHGQSHRLKKRPQKHAVLAIMTSFSHSFKRQQRISKWKNDSAASLYLPHLWVIFFQTAYLKDCRTWTNDLDGASPFVSWPFGGRRCSWICGCWFIYPALMTHSDLHSCSTVMKEDVLLDGWWILHPNYIISLEIHCLTHTCDWYLSLLDRHRFIWQGLAIKASKS